MRRMMMMGLAMGLAGCGSLSPARFAATGSGLTSHQLCSEVFIGGRDPERAYRQGVAPMLGSFAGLARWTVNRARGEVSASLVGQNQRAVYSGGLGCVRSAGGLTDGAASPRPETVVMDPPLLAPIAPSEAVVEPSSSALKEALDHAFAEPAKGRRNTQAVIVMREGRILAERYGPGIAVDSPLTGWSMSKSVTNALVGVLVRQGRLSVSGPAPIAAWADPGDPRHAVSLENLLRMQSGLDAGQSLSAGPASGLDPAAQMLFDEPDMAGFAAGRPLKVPPGSNWNYSDISYLLVSRAIGQAAGGSPAAVMDLARRELFGPLGMSRVTVEFDAAGTPIGSSHVWAPARDWARLGQLYLDDGVVGGRRILPEGWVDWSARQTPGSDSYGYGAGFWTNRGGGDGAGRRIAMGIPADAFMARGNMGQYVVIVPSARLVVVRMGPVSGIPYEDMAAVARLVKEAMAATEPAIPVV